MKIEIDCSDKKSSESFEPAIDQLDKRISSDTRN